MIYDSRQNMWAARLWWMLRYFGFDNAAVLKKLSDALNEISELKHFRECDELDECVCHVGIANKALGWEVNE